MNFFAHCAAVVNTYFRNDYKMMIVGLLNENGDGIMICIGSKYSCNFNYRDMQNLQIVERGQWFFLLVVIFCF